jgi:transcriptional regulator with XRE-family HTH domain
MAGPEFRFLRKQMGLSTKDLAEIMRVHRESVTRWETGGERIGTQSDRLIRLVHGVRCTPEGGEAPASLAADPRRPDLHPAEGGAAPREGYPLPCSTDGSVRPPELPFAREGRNGAGDRNRTEKPQADPLGLVPRSPADTCARRLLWPQPFDIRHPQPAGTLG